jgi:hypothetical protein
MHFLFLLRHDVYALLLGKTRTVIELCHYVLRRALMQPNEFWLDFAAKAQI